MTDHQIAAYLKKHDALHNWKHDGNNTAWYNDNGEIVASVEYDNSRSVKLSILTFKPL